MALWNQIPPVENNNKPNPQPAAMPITPTAKPEVAASEAPQAAPVSPPKESAQIDRRESVFGPGVSIEGKIEGDTSVHIAGKFKGDIQIKGDLDIEKGARIHAKIHAANVNISGELDGNVVAAGQVKLLESGKIIGDLKATSLTVVSGSRMRGHVEFGFGAVEAVKVVNGGAQEKEKNKPSE